jgi:hypothetical protein
MLKQRPAEGLHDVRVVGSVASATLSASELLELHPSRGGTKHEVSLVAGVLTVKPPSVPHRPPQEPRELLIDMYEALLASASGSS